MTSDSSTDSRGLATRSIHRLQYLAASPLLFLLPRIPFSLLPPLARRLGDLAFFVDGKHRRRAEQNLKLALPQLDARERRRITRASFRHLAVNPLEAVAGLRHSREELLGRFDCVGWENLERAEAAGRGVIFLSGHFGSWAAGEQFLALSGRSFAMLARAVDNPLFEAWVLKMRGHLGNRSIPKRSGARRLIKELRSGGRIAILMDQRVHPNEGKAYRFLGHPAYTTPLPALLSLRTGAPAVSLFCYPIDGGRRCRIVIREPIFPDVEGDDAVDRLTLRYLGLLEEAIRADPELWVWMHRRWRKNPTTKFKKRLPKTAAGPDSTEVVERRRG